MRYDGVEFGNCMGHAIRKGKSMRSQAQIEASRRNGALSRGPVTEEGKARCQRNALRHGLAARKIVLLDEEEQSFREYHEAFVRDLRPRSALEETLIERIALASWRLRRAAWMEAGIIQVDQEAAHNRQTGQFSTHKRTEAWQEPAPAVMGYVLREALGKKNCVYDVIGRYERRLERGMYAAIRELRALRQEGGEAARETMGEPEGEERHTASACVPAETVAKEDGHARSDRPCEPACVPALAEAPAGGDGAPAGRQAEDASMILPKEPKTESQPATSAALPAEQRARSPFASAAPSTRPHASGGGEAWPADPRPAARPAPAGPAGAAGIQSPFAGRQGQAPLADRARGAGPPPPAKEQT